VIADLSEAGDQDIIRKVQADMKAAGVASDEGQLKVRLIELMAQAIKQIEEA
jgi:hypothetical protein